MCISSILMHYWKKTILECSWCLTFSAKIAHTKIWRMAILTWTKPGNNLEFVETGNPVCRTMHFIACYHSKAN